MPAKLALIIMDGWGIADDPSVSAIDNAHVPFYRQALARYPNSTLLASEQAVGLPVGQMGNSEVGHMNLGAGRVVFQELERISDALRTGAFDRNPVVQQLIAYCKTQHKPLHLLGLVSDGGVHSHLDHLKGILSVLAVAGLNNVFIHAFTDGRDTDPRSGLRHIQLLEDHLARIGTGRIASLVGRYYAMDRDKRWERIRVAYDLLVNGKGTPYPTAYDALQAAYASEVTDEFLKPAYIAQDGHPMATIQPGDAVLFFNFRTDRGRELTEVLTQTDLQEHAMHRVPDLHYCTLTRYDERYENVQAIFDKDNIQHTLGEVLAQHSKKQIRIAETEKYPHVTFFFNGGREEAFAGEQRILCPSPKVATYDLQPEMSAHAIRDAIIPAIEKGEADFICLNYANPDMVGHTGVWQAAIRAVETVDACVHDVVAACQRHGYHAIILADHGNADKMRNPDGSPHTAHTLARVPFIFVPADDKTYTILPGKLGDVAPTILSLMNIPIPAEMTGHVRIYPKA